MEETSSKYKKSFQEEQQYRTTVESKFNELHSRYNEALASKSSLERQGMDQSATLKLEINARIHLLEEVKQLESKQNHDKVEFFLSW